MPKISVKKPYMVLVSVLVLVVLGVTGFTRMTTDFLPEMELPYMMVATAYPGASPQKVETEITDPIENNISTINGVKNVISTSSENSSRVMLEFENDTNMDSAMIKVTTAINQLELPERSSKPIILEVSMDMLPVSYISVDYKGKEGTELSSYINDEIIPELKRQDGVASVQTAGMVTDSLEIKLSKKKVDALNDKIRASVIEKLDDAKASLDQAQSALNSASSNLQKQQKNLDKQKNKTAGETAKLTKMMNQALATQTAMNSQVTSLEAYETGLKAEKSGYEQMLNAMGDQVKLLPEGNPARAQYDAATKRVSEIDAELSNIKTEKAAAKAASEAAGKQLEKATKNYENVESGKMTAAAAFGSGAAQLSAAQQTIADNQKELDDGLKSYEDSRKQALENADASQLLSLDTLQGIIDAQNFSMPAGYVNDEDMQYLLKIDEETKSRKAMNNLVIANIDGVGDIRMKDVATVKVVDNADNTYAKVNGNDAAVLAVYKSSSAGTSAVSKALKETEEKLEKDNKGLHFTSLMDQGDYIAIIIQSVFTNLIAGALLAILILILFLRSIRPTVVVALAIPLSVLFAILAMYFSDISMNIISLSGLALGIGMLVDNAIVVVENIYRLKAQGMSAARAAVMGANQVAGAITASTLTTICVFVPIMFTDGLTKTLMIDMALTITYSLLASLIVALSVVPSLSSTLLKNAQPKEEKFMNRLKEKYETALTFCLRMKFVPIAIAIVLLGICAAKVMSTGIVIIPEMSSNQMSMQMQTKQESSTEEDYELMDKISKEVAAVKGVKTVGTIQATSLGMGGGSQDKSYTAMVLLEDEYANQNTKIAGKVEKILAGEELEEFTVQASNMDTSQMFGQGLQVDIYGDDEEELLRISKDMMKLAGEIKGFENISNNQDAREKELVLNIDKDKAMHEGLTIAQIYQALQKKLTTDQKATTIERNGSTMDGIIVDKTDELTRSNLLDFEIEVEQAAGQSAQSSSGSGSDSGSSDSAESSGPKKVRLGDIATVKEQDGVSDIRHENGSRMMSVTADTKEGYNTTLLSRLMQKNIDNYDAPSGYKLEIAGEVESVNKMVRDMLLMMLVAVILIYLIMLAQFANFLSPFIVMFTIPLAFTGGFIALMVTGQELSMIALMGFLILSGVVVNNGIVFIDYANQLRRAGMEKRRALIETGKARMRPIMMTALTTVLAMSVMAVSKGQGAEMGKGMAIVTIGGLLYATLMTLFIVPVLYDIFYRKKEMKVVDLGNEEELKGTSAPQAILETMGSAGQGAAPGALTEGKSRSPLRSMQRGRRPR
ncbi:MAG: efflux RND transporter permease subunit [Firmicutes bacterium]|nr:efflux RND transporter permease subunit [Bacillota bacterium]